MNKSLSIQSSVIYVVQSLIVAVFPVLLFPVIAHALPPEAFGVYALAVVYASILIGLANLGCIVGYERNFFLVEESIEKSGVLLTTIQIFILVTFSLVGVAVYWSSDFVSEIILGEKAYAWLWVLVFTSVSISVFCQYYLTYLKNSGMAKPFFVITVLQALLNFSIAIWLLKSTDYGVYSLVYASLASNLGLLLMGGVYQLRQLPVGFDVLLLREVLKISLPLTPRVLFGFLNTQFDKIMLGAIASLGGVGVYSMAQKISSFIYVFMTALDRVFKPQVYRMLFEGSDSAVVGRYLTPFIYVSILPALFLVLFSYEVVMGFLSDEYLEASNILVVLSLYYVFLFFGKINGVQLVHAKKTWLTSKLALVGVIVNVALNMPFIYFWGAIGAAVATTLAGIVMAVITNAYAQQCSRISWDYVVVARMLTVLYLSAVFVICVDVFGVLSYQWVLVGKLGFIALYVYVGFKSGVLGRANLRHLMVALRKDATLKNL